MLVGAYIACSLYDVKENSSHSSPPGSMMNEGRDFRGETIDLHREIGQSLRFCPKLRLQCSCPSENHFTRA